MTNIIKETIDTLRLKKDELRCDALFYNRRRKGKSISVRTYNCLRESAKITVAILALQQMI